MARYRKLDGSVTLTATDGRIEGNIAADALGGPSPAPGVPVSSNGVDVEARDMVAASLVAAHAVGDRGKVSSLAGVLRAVDAGVPGGASFDELLGFARGLTAGPDVVVSADPTLGANLLEVRLMVLAVTRWFAGLLDDECAIDAETGDILSFVDVRRDWLAPFLTLRVDASSLDSCRIGSRDGSGLVLCRALRPL